MKKASKLYPHIEELKAYVLAYKQEFERLTKNTHKFLKNENMLKTIFSNSKEGNIKEVLKAEMLRFTEWYIDNNLKKENETPKNQPLRETKMLSSQTKMTESRIYKDRINENNAMKSSMSMSQNEAKFKETKNSSDYRMTESRQFIDRVIDVGSVYDATSFANLLGLPRDELKSEDILNLILYCSFDLEINCK